MLLKILLLIICSCLSHAGEDTTAPRFRLFELIIQVVIFFLNYESNTVDVPSLMVHTLSFWYQLQQLEDLQCYITELLHYKTKTFLTAFSLIMLFIIYITCFNEARLSIDDKLNKIIKRKYFHFHSVLFLNLVNSSYFICELCGCVQLLCVYLIEFFRVSNLKISISFMKKNFLSGLEDDKRETIYRKSFIYQYVSPLLPVFFEDIRTNIVDRRVGKNIHLTLSGFYASGIGDSFSALIPNVYYRFFPKNRVNDKTVFGLVSFIFSTVASSEIINSLVKGYYCRLEILLASVVTGVFEYYCTDKVDNLYLGLVFYAVLYTSLASKLVFD